MRQPAPAHSTPNPYFRTLRPGSEADRFSRLWPNGDQPPEGVFPRGCHQAPRYSVDVSQNGAATYVPLGGERHRHGAGYEHAHPHSGPPGHDDHAHEHRGHGHSHGLVDDSIKRSREGVRAVAVALAVLTVTALLQAVVFVLTDSVALLADLIHNAGDALTAVPLGIAFLLHSARG